MFESRFEWIELGTKLVELAACRDVWEPLADLLEESESLEAVPAATSAGRADTIPDVRLS